MGNEKLDVDVSRGARLLSQLIVSAKKFGKPIELQDTRRSTGHDKDAREGLMAGVKRSAYFPWLLRWELYKEGEGRVQEFCCRHCRQWLSGSTCSMMRCPTMKSAGASRSCQNIGWHLIKMSNTILYRQERLLEATEGRREMIISPDKSQVQCARHEKPPAFPRQGATARSTRIQTDGLDDTWHEREMVPMTTTTMKIALNRTKRTQTSPRPWNLIMDSLVMTVDDLEDTLWTCRTRKIYDNSQSPL